MRREEKRRSFNFTNRVQSLLDTKLWKPLNYSKNKAVPLPITSYPLPDNRGVAFVSHNHQFIYYEVPKAACSSIKLFIGTIDGIIENLPRNVHSLPIPKLSLPEARLTLYKDYFHFTFVRNPYDRLLSCYIEKVYEPGSGLRNRPFKFPNGEFNEFLRHYGQLEFRKMSFGDFIQFVTRVPNRHCNKHFIPQHCLLNLDVLDFIGHIENFDQDFLYVRKQIGLSDDIPQPQKMNASKHSHYQSYYNDKLRKMVACKYARDLEIFNYDF